MAETVHPEPPVTLQALTSINVEQDKKGNKERLQQMDGVEGLAKTLGVDISTGLTTAQVDAMRTHYGRNEFPASPMTTFLELFFGTFEDPVLMVLIAAAVVSLCTSGILHDEWLEGIAIFIAVFLVAIIDSAQNYSKELKFRALEASAARDERTSVLRDGSIQRLNPIELVIGDIVVLQAGESIPADAVVVDHTTCKANEAALTGEPDDLKKTKAGDCFLLSSCVITEADETRAMCIGVGEFSQWGKIKANLVSEPTNTPLQDKLEEMTALISWIGGGSAVATFIVILIRALAIPNEDEEVWEQLLDGLIIAITIVVVAIPEGLPLAVTIALAYSTNKMYEDQNLIRELSACETMGNATNICSDKTGTLTENQMTVVAGMYFGEKYDQEAFEKMQASEALKTIVGIHTCVNRVAYFVYKDESGQPLHRPQCIGNKTEGALMSMSKTWGMDDEEVRRQNYKEDRDKVFAFNSSKKRSTAMIKQADGSTRVYCKGATEWVLKDCTKYTDANGNVQPLDASKREEINAYVLEMANQALRTLCLTHRDIPQDQVTAEMMETPPDDKELVMDCIVGIIDPLRPDVKEAVKTAQRAGVTVRMVTGDNIATAKAIARQCGILTDDGEAIEGPDFRNMTPAAVDALLPRLQVMGRSSPEDKFLMVTRLNGYGLPKSKEDWEEKHKTKVGVSWDADKDKLMPGYEEEWKSTRPEGGEVVGVTGDGTNDAPALKAADVGLAMGITGTAVAQGASDIVILDDKFSSIVKAILWGRNVYDNIRKFLQFQLTVNVVALLTVFIAAASGKAPPLNAVQMLWVNLIMDTLGALALATEPPTQELLERLPYKRSAQLVSLPMWRNILCQSVFQVILLMVLMFAGTSLFEGVKEHEWCITWEIDTGAKSGMEYNSATSSWEDDDVGNCFGENDGDCGCNAFYLKCGETENGECYDDHFDGHDDFVDDCKFECKEKDHHHATIMFNAFIFCQFFNEYTARSIGDKLNPFEGITKNPVFLGVSLFTLAIQIILICFCGAFIETKPYPGLSVNEWLVTVALGAISLPVGVLMRLIPVKEDPNSFFRSGGTQKKPTTMLLYDNDSMEKN